MNEVDRVGRCLLWPNRSTTESLATGTQPRVQQAARCELKEFEILRWPANELKEEWEEVEGCFIGGSGAGLPNHNKAVVGRSRSKRQALSGQWNRAAERQDGENRRIGWQVVVVGGGRRS